MSQNKFESPEQIYGPLFYDVHRAGIFSDGKQFADLVAKMHPDIIVKTYLTEKNQAPFDLMQFVDKYFKSYEPTGINETKAASKPIDEHINQLWKDLARPADKIKKNRSSKIPLPFPYIVPGGRFDEIYYWDSYFTMLGLKESGQVQMIENMVDNFTHLINSFGFIPNGNRSYFLSRSQPPFFSLMVKLLIKEKGGNIINKYLPALVTEYNFWMRGITSLSDNNGVIDRLVRLEEKILLNRYYDAKETPREEMYRDDWSLTSYSDKKNQPLYRELRGACESGWDFSSRWLSSPNDLKTVHITSLLPIDLNCLLWHLEKLISECYNKIGNSELSLNYGIIAHNRKKAILSLFWNNEAKYFFDYNWKAKEQSDKLSLGGIFPLFFKLCSDEQAKGCAKMVETQFLRDGGVVTTPYHTGQQWDAPNGWAPLQWITIKGLLNYGHKKLAQEIAYRWTSLNKSVYDRTGRMLEKYNVEDTDLEGGGGEYPVQDGFGWTNGVYVALTAKKQASNLAR